MDEFLQNVATEKYKAEDQHIFVIDDNMYYRSMRHEYFQLARKCKKLFHNLHTLWIYLPIMMMSLCKGTVVSSVINRVQITV